MISGLALVTALTLAGQAREPVAGADTGQARAPGVWTPLFNNGQIWG